MRSEFVNSTAFPWSLNKFGDFITAGMVLREVLLGVVLLLSWSY